MRRWQRELRQLLQEGAWIETPDGEYLSANWKDVEKVYRFAWPIYKDYRLFFYEHNLTKRQVLREMSDAVSELMTAAASQHPTDPTAIRSHVLAASVQRHALEAGYLKQLEVPRRFGGGHGDYQTFKEHLIQRCVKKFELVPVTQ